MFGVLMTLPYRVELTNGSSSAEDIPLEDEIAATQPRSAAKLGWRPNKRDAGSPRSNVTVLPCCFRCVGDAIGAPGSTLRVSEGVVRFIFLGRAGTPLTDERRAGVRREIKLAR